MAKKDDTGLISSTEHGSVEFEMRCHLCGTDLSKDWPDLSKLNPPDIKNHALDEWRAAADWGCSFCKIVISVLDDSWKQYGCYDCLYWAEPEKIPDKQGFQVLLHPNAKGQYLLSLEHIMMPLLAGSTQKEFRGTITIYLDGPDTFDLKLEPFFEIPSHSGSQQVLRLARDWLMTCRNYHPGCSTSPNRHEHSSRRPDAAIRMIETRGSGPRLVQLRLCEVLPAYIALSHCWGSSTASTLKTLSTNIESFQGAIPFASLPTTFRHAIEVTKSLGFEYIWIDSLCIIQDSLLDWEEQSSQMAFIYSNADLVLAASSAISTEDGFLKGRKPWEAYRESNLNVESLRDRTHAICLKYRLLQRKGMAPMLDPLDRRAWALQERLLARRYLAYGSHDISWSCMSSSACECEWWRVATTWRGEIQSIESYLPGVKDDELGDYWRSNVLENYLQRSLSHQSDKLVALSALASAFDSRMGSGYLAGLWRGDLHVALLWSNSRPQSGYMDDRPGIPSWSWASLPLHKFSVPLWSSRDGQTLANVLEATTKPSTVNQFGSVNGGSIRLWGELWNTDLTARNFQKTLNRYDLLRNGINIRVNGFLKEPWDGWVNLDTSLIKTKVFFPNGARQASLRRIRHDEVREKQYIAGFRKDEVVHLFMIPLFKQYVFGLFNRVHGLLVTRSFRHPTVFERIGTFTFSEACGNEPGAPHAEKVEQEIVVI